MMKKRFERRKSQRKTATVDIWVTYPGHRRKRCRTANLSAGGVYISTEKVSVPQGITVELVFVVHRDRVIRLHRRWAVVAHVGNNGAGMMLYNGKNAFPWASPQISV